MNASAAQGLRNANRVLAFINSYHAKQGYPPTYEEIAAGCDLAKSTVHLCIERLARLGKIKLGPARSVRQMAVVG